MRIIKGADRGRQEWTARKLLENIEYGVVNFDIDIQRGYVWKKDDKKSALIKSMILDRYIPPLVFNKIEDVYEAEDGKQRALTVSKYVNDEFSLSGLDVFPIINDDGEAEEVDINGLKYSELPDAFKDAIKDYSFIIVYTDNADEEEVADSFYNLNNGQAINAATKNRVKAKCRKQIARLGSHQLFADALSKTALDGHVNEDLAVKAHAILHDADHIDIGAPWTRKYMASVNISEDDEKELNDIFDRIRNVHDTLTEEDKKVAQKIYRRTHLISIVPITKRSIEDGLSENEFQTWIMTFFAGNKATVSKAYNDAAGAGSGKHSSVMKRLEEIKKSYDAFIVKKKEIGDENVA